jgi:hypothetical protein
MNTWAAESRGDGEASCCLKIAIASLNFGFVGEALRRTFLLINVRVIR